MYTGENRQITAKQRQKKSWDKNLDAASGITFRSQEVFSKSTQKLYIYFALCEGIQ
jgi:hypothetical protein